MSHGSGTTLVAIFAELADAQQAGRELDAAGIDRERVRIAAAASIADDVGTGATSLTGWAGLFRRRPRRLGHGASDEIALLAEIDRGMIPAAVNILRRYGATRIDQNPPSGDGAGPAAPVRVEPQITERLVEEPVAVAEEIIQVERRPADRPATDDDFRNWSTFAAGGLHDGKTGVVVPVLEERLEINKKRRETARVRVHKSLASEERTVQETFVEQTYDVEHVPVNLEVPEAPAPRYEGDTLVLPVVEEVLVVEKRLVLREEIRITRRRQERKTPRTHTLRREHVHLERTYPE